MDETICTQIGKVLAVNFTLLTNMNNALIGHTKPKVKKRVIKKKPSKKK